MKKSLLFSSLLLSSFYTAFIFASNNEIPKMTQNDFNNIYNQSLRAPLLEVLKKCDKDNECVKMVIKRLLHLNKYVLFGDEEQPITHVSNPDNQMPANTLCEQAKIKSWLCYDTCRKFLSSNNDTNPIPANQLGQHPNGIRAKCYEIGKKHLAKNNVTQPTPQQMRTAFKECALFAALELMRLHKNPIFDDKNIDHECNVTYQHKETTSKTTESEQPTVKHEAVKQEMNNAIHKATNPEFIATPNAAEETLKTIELKKESDITATEETVQALPAVTATSQETTNTKN